MASSLLHRTSPRRVLNLVGLGLSSAFVAHSLGRRDRTPLLCEGVRAQRGTADAFRSYQHDAQVPVVKDGRVNAAAFRQVSSGSILGLVGGLAVSTFSRSLAFLIGLLVFGAQYMSSKGYNVVPTARLQRYVKGINVRSAVEDNVAFKLSLGATFMLAAFAEF